MINAGLVLVHGMGHQDAGWSGKMQQALKSSLPNLNINPVFYETLYSDLVEGKTFQAVFAKKTRDLTPTDIKVMFNVQRMEAAIGLAVAKMAPSDVSRKGFSDEAIDIFNNLMRYVAGYLFNNRLKSQINTRIRKALADASTAAGRDGRVLLIGHSLGSVVSWSVATDNNYPLPDRFYKLVTLGSPLGFLESIDIIKPNKAPYYWANVSAPGDIVSAIGVDDPPFSSDKGLVALRVRRVSSDPHGSLINDAGVVADWMPMLA
ncbi:MAG: hypothetical protein ABSG90_02110 [Dehalococcoidia bacterium]|jgi:hypothetical protein